MANPNKGKQQIVRSRDADEWLDRANITPDKAKQEQYSLRARMTRLFGLYNERHNFHLGRPKGSSQEDQDELACRFMERVHAETGIDRPHTLGRMALEAGKADKRGSTGEAVIKRLAQRWSKRQSRTKVQK